MPRKDKVIHISNLPSTFRGNVTRNGRFIQNGIPPLGGVYDKVVKSTGLIRLGNEFLYNGVNNLVSKDNREKLMNNTAGRLINYVKDFNKESFPSDDELGPTFPFNIIQTPRSNGKKLPQKQYAVGGKIPNVVAGGIAQPLGNNFFYMNGRKHSQGGIDIGPSDKTGIEVEDGEVVETNGNELKVYSAQPILNGASPAQLVMGGANPNKVFKAQEDFKDRNRINDDGSKYQNGGIKKNNYNKNDNTTVAKPVIQEYIPATGSTKFIQDLRNKLTRNNTIKGGNINIVSPEFDILTGIRGIANTSNNIINNYIGRKLPNNYAYRRTLQQELDDIINNNVFRKIPNNITVPKGKTITTSSGKKISLHKAGGNSHGGKAFSAGKVWDGTSSSGNKSKEIIIGVPGENAEWMVGHHGSYKGPYKFNDIEQGSGLFVPFDENNIANISTNGLRAYKPSIFNNRYIPIELDKKRMGGLSRDKDYGSKKKPYPSVAKKDFAGGHRSYPIPTKADAVDALRLAGLHGRSDVKAKVYNKYPELRKKGNVGLVVSINGNVKNGLIHSPSSTGGLRDKFAVGGNRINRHGRTWEYDEKIGAYVPITNRTINRTSAYPINKSARGETIIGSDYTFRNGRWSKNNNVNTNTNKPNIDNGNRRPQYYAERRLPLFEDGAGITSGLVRAGWSHGNNKGISTNNTNIPSLSETKSSGKTPRGERSKSSQSTQSVPTKTLPTAVYSRNLPKVEASIPTTLPVSTSTPAKGTTSSDGKGQGRFKNLTTADWIGLGSNVAGSLASYFASKRAINKMRGPGQPTLISANKLKTKYNINPQLDRIREDKFEAYRDIDSNTASSRVSLARKQRVRNAAGQAANELYGNKENIETNLINQDRRNQQSVRQFNAQQYNQYIDRKAAFDNGIREAKVTNINNLFSGINAGIQDMISRYENRKALNNTIGAMRASAPNVDDRIMRDAGVDYDEFIIRKRRKLGGKQSCR
ncbi:hypothetical protein [Pseudoruminococcus massiliensis]|uniref:hypothetical protein n=1 Tax=Pseudoruminococcus massiliensis TaxID=2086583 RepID=UPI003FD899A0